MARGRLRHRYGRSLPHGQRSYTIKISGGQHAGEYSGGRTVARGADDRGFGREGGKVMARHGLRKRSDAPIFNKATREAVAHELAKRYPRGEE
jgi:hypothetical protein